MVWRVCDITSYGGRIEVRPEGDSDMVEWDPANEWDAEEGEEVDPELLTRLQSPARVPKWGRFQPGQFVHVAFDGGA